MVVLSFGGTTCATPTLQNHGPAIGCKHHVATSYRKRRAVMPRGDRETGSTGQGGIPVMPDGTHATRKPGTGLLNAPNIVTLARLCAVPLAFWLVIEHRMAWAFCLFVLAGLSDALDGWLARRYGGNAV